MSFIKQNTPYSSRITHNTQQKKEAAQNAGPIPQILGRLLEDQIECVRIEKNDPAYCLNENRKEEIYQTLKTLPETMKTKAGVINVHQLLIEFVDLCGYSAGAHFDTGVKHGFSLALKLIFHHLIQ